MAKTLVTRNGMWEFDRPRLGRLADAYERAHTEGSDSFIFDGVKLLTRYAKYLIEYLDYRLD